jgi:transposase InsO family protein
MSATPRVFRSLKTFIQNFAPSKQAGLIFHSDRGSQYASKNFRDVLEEYGIASSMSRRGNCWDNACSETLFGSLKVERLHGQRFETRRQAKDRVIAWLLWYNQTRMHSTLAYVSPVRFEQDGLRLRQCKPIRDSAMGYGFQGQGQNVIMP